MSRSSRSWICALTLALLASWVVATPVAAAVTAAAGDEIAQVLAGEPHDHSQPTPAEAFGFEPGAWHVRPEQISAYARVLASSPRVSLQPYGSSHEARPLALLAITSASNQVKLESLRAQHIEAVLAGRPPATDAPIVVWLGYSVHGNEPSGANAAMLVAWHLATGTSAWVKELLDNAIVLIDPVINPDGLARFAHWANMHQGRQRVPTPTHREHREPWPSGRGNHYWFDLNRDWLLAVHPESQGRLDAFHDWRPTVLADFHEMGTGSSFFFQPGVPSRNHPLTPAPNLKLTRALAAYHAAALDALGQAYYSEEGFDDFYYGKGSTYPDALGSIGILFEQASSRGHLQENAWGELPFELTIRNQIATSLSTLRGALDLRRELLAYQAETTKTALEGDGAHEIWGWVVGSGGDSVRLHALARLLARHQISCLTLASDMQVHGQDFAAAAGQSLLVPLRQPNGRLARGLFEQRTSFEDDSFYDISAWTLPLAYGLPFAELSAADLPQGALGPATEPATDRVSAGTLEPGSAADTVAYVLPWTGLHVARALGRLHAAELTLLLATQPFTGNSASGAEAFDAGAVIVPNARQPLDADALQALLQQVCLDNGVHLRRLVSGLTPNGIDLGSPSMAPLTAPRVTLLVGDGVSSTDVGEIWHHLDARLGLAVTLVDRHDLARHDLDADTHLILVDGASSALGERGAEQVKSWVRAGGVLICLRGSASWAGKSLLDWKPDEKKDSGDADTEPAAEVAYADYEGERAKELLSGALFGARVDASHPLAFGLDGRPLSVFRRGTVPMDEGKDPFAIPVRYLDAPRQAGYAAQKFIDALAGTAAVTATRLGSGTVIRLADDPVFRGYTLGSARLLENALFFGASIKRTGALGSPDDGAHTHAEDG